LNTLERYSQTPILFIDYVIPKCLVRILYKCKQTWRTYDP